MPTETNDVRTELERSADDAAEASRIERDATKESDAEAIREEITALPEVTDQFDREVDFEATGDTQFGTVSVQAPGTDKVVTKSIPTSNVDPDDAEDDKGMVVTTQVRVAD